MRDIDAIQAYEFKQQELVRAIINSIQDATSEHKDYRKFFNRLAVAMLQDLGNLSLTTRNIELLHLRAEIRDKINNFLVEQYQEDVLEPGERALLPNAERAYLHWRVLEKLLESVGSGFVTSYSALEINRQYA